LVTGMVGEFPELQGVIGGYLAEAQGEPKVVADAIRDHYGTPGQSASIFLALADKLDSISSFFAVDEKPTGSKDPFAVRRAALQAIDIIITNGLRLTLTAAVRGSLANLAAQNADPGLTHRLDRTAPQVLAFFADRLKVQQREAGVRHDLIDAVFALGGEDDLVRLLARVKALQEFVGTDDGANLLTAYKRAANILKKEEWDPAAAEERDFLDEEVSLAKQLDVAADTAATAIEVENFGEAMEALSTLRQPIDAFFDKVTVNADDKGVRARRLNLLARFRDAVNAVADFSKIEG
jgi:glycyl-tRNA synthetase beta chain